MILIQYVLINRARGPYEKTFVLTFKAYGPNSVRTEISVNKSLLYIYINKMVYGEILQSKSVVNCVSALPGPCAGSYAHVRTVPQPIRSKNSFRISVSIQEF